MSAADPHHSILPEWLRKGLDGLYLVSGWLAGLFLISIFVIMLALSAGRPLGIDVPAGDDFASWAMAASAFLGLAHTFRSGEMIRVGLLIERMTGRTRQLFEVVALLIGSAAAVYFAWYAFDMNRTSWAFNDLAQGVIAMPLWIPQIGFSGGLIILAVAMVDELVHVLFGGLPRYEKPAPDTPEEAIERAIQSGA
ncbi:TRAP transporter small permease [Aliirhizobium cellulosilyticum]|uniref:TRAP transporter small permease protein n=1 Tax=Aliirhizobium cellulosilyticum TaxID=393664 RepID=A0A7W6TF42_9HYPH|nr:TRAP transporter small permease [Rhizobium cellulosilyticum]MBB4349692.1 TRAP-type C4-dicarboxylate transport system permease small subunit [Rhizobium cellulosilyticum]MBB4412087.1 TRAP-type C4-dicarboxylate transport system permease small subunit [Rhizobium cellulosilyticum]MBB4446718.1 TRAP-type C4-dicarboxylate transport system permease small subunit [Rhizobium cellulosilyticum]